MSDYETEYHDSDEEDNHSVASLMGSIKNYSQRKKHSIMPLTSLAQKNPFSSKNKHSGMSVGKRNNFQSAPIRIESLSISNLEPDNLTFSAFSHQDPQESDKDLMLKAPLKKPLKFKKKGGPEMSRSGNFTGPSFLSIGHKGTMQMDRSSHFRGTGGAISRFSQTKRSIKFSTGTKSSVGEIMKTLNSFEDSQGEMSEDSGNRERISLIDYREIKKEEIYSFDMNIVISYIMQELGEEFSFAELKKAFLPSGRKSTFAELAFFRHYELVFFPDGPDDEE